MTLEEAIKHAEKAADEKKEEACNLYNDKNYEESRECIWCAEEHRQLAEWLKELNQLREQESKILETLDFAIDASNGDTNYFVGFRNGLRYAKSLIDGEEEPPFESCVKQEPILDKIRAEVEALNQDYYCAGDFNKCKDYVLDILDEYRNSRKESEVTE